MSNETVSGRNGVAIAQRERHGESGYRTFEVYQRERVGESTELIKPRELVSDAFRKDPYPLLGVLRENYPCYRDWMSNRYWITRYDDVTSIFADDANFETRSKAWFYGLEGYGRDFNHLVSLQRLDEQITDSLVAEIAEELAQGLRHGGDLATGFAARLPLCLLAASLGLPDDEVDGFCAAFWQAQRGVSWMPELQKQGLAALAVLERLFQGLISERRTTRGDDLVSVMLSEVSDLTARDVVITVLERDHQTLHGTLANLWLQLLTDSSALDAARSDRRLMKLAYLEALRHSAPVLSAWRFARHEVERFGRLLPEGALLLCSAGAANRDPRVFQDADRFIVDRRDLCQREPRGQYRADGLATGIAFGLGKPSKYPALPEDRPRSRYAITRDAAVAASMVLLDQLPDLRLVDGANPELTSLTLGEMHTCWRLPVAH